MAESGNVPELGGYDYEFTSKVPEYWECLVCHLTLKDPVQIEKCGHRLCRICMESLFRRPSPTCPADRQPLSREKIFSDNACHRQILDLTVKCSHSGCSWTGELRAVEKHQSECLFKEVKCSNSGCAMMLSKRDMKTHETSECSWRKVNCEYCQESVIMNQKQKHYDICRRFPVLCTNKCGVRDIPREELEVHVRDECPATEVQCEYKNLGCDAVFPRSDAKSHSQTQIESHLNLALRGLEATQHQVNELVTVVKDQSQQIERQSQQIDRLMSTDKAQSKQKEKMISNDKKQSEQGKRSKSTVQDQSLQGERRGPINQIFLTPFEWKIPSIRVGPEHQSLVSEPFYLFERGYKYLLKIEIPDFLLNMWSASLGGLHPKVLIKVVPGEFDELLSWPCKEKVRVTFVDQARCQDNRENISHVIDLGKDVLPFRRPLHDNSHDYRYIFGLKPSQYRSYANKNETALIRVNRE